MIDIKDEYAGRWAGVLKSLGMTEKYLLGKHGECPVCGDNGKNARWHTKKEYNVCSKCGINQPMELALQLTGKSFIDTARIIRGAKITMEKTAKYNDVEKNRERLKSIYVKRKPLINTQAQKYLESRGLSVLPGKDVFFIEEADYWTEIDGKVTKEILPAMVSVIRNLAGETISYHMTYLRDGQKIARKVLPQIGELAGCAIQMFQPESGVLAVAEGVETALSVYEIEGVPVWAAGNAWQLENIQIPELVNELWIYADTDKSFTGQAAAYGLAKRMIQKIEKVRVCTIHKRKTTMVGDEFVWITDGGSSQDFLDQLND